MERQTKELLEIVGSIVSATREYFSAADTDTGGGAAAAAHYTKWVSLLRDLYGLADDESYWSLCALVKETGIVASLCDIWLTAAPQPAAAGTGARGDTSMSTKDHAAAVGAALRCLALLLRRTSSTRICDHILQRSRTVVVQCITAVMKLPSLAPSLAELFHLMFLSAAADRLRKLFREGQLLEVLLALAKRAVERKDWRSAAAALQLLRHLHVQPGSLADSWDDHLNFVEVAAGPLVREMLMACYFPVEGEEGVPVVSSPSGPMGSSGSGNTLLRVASATAIGSRWSDEETPSLSLVAGSILLILVDMIGASRDTSRPASPAAEEEDQTTIRPAPHRVSPALCTVCTLLFESDPKLVGAIACDAQNTTAFPQLQMQCCSALLFLYSLQCTPSTESDRVCARATEMVTISLRNHLFGDGSGGAPTQLQLDELKERNVLVSPQFANLRAFVKCLGVHLRTIQREHTAEDRVAHSLTKLLHAAPPTVDQNEINLAPFYRFCLTRTRRAVPVLVSALSHIDIELNVRTCRLLSFALSDDTHAVREFLSCGGLSLLYDALFDYTEDVIAASFELLTVLGVFQEAVDDMSGPKDSIITRSVHVVSQLAMRLTQDSASISESYLAALQAGIRFLGSTRLQLPDTGLARRVVGSLLLCIEQATSCDIASAAKVAMFAANELSSGLNVPLLRPRSAPPTVSATPEPTRDPLACLKKALQTYSYPAHTPMLRQQQHITSLGSFNLALEAERRIRAAALFVSVIRVLVSYGQSGTDAQLSLWRHPKLIDAVWEQLHTAMDSMCVATDEMMLLTAATTASDGASAPSRPISIDPSLAEDYCAFLEAVTRSALVVCEDSWTLFSTVVQGNSAVTGMVLSWKEAALGPLLVQRLDYLSQWLLGSTVVKQRYEGSIESELSNACLFLAHLYTAAGSGSGTSTGSGNGSRPGSSVSLPRTAPSNVATLSGLDTEAVSETVLSLLAAGGSVNANVRSACVSALLAAATSASPASIKVLNHQRLTAHLASTIQQCEYEDTEPSSMLANKAFKLLIVCANSSIPQLLAIGIEALKKMNAKASSVVPQPAAATVGTANESRSLPSGSGGSNWRWEPLEEPGDDPDEAHDLLVLLLPLFNGLLHHDSTCREVARSIDLGGQLLIPLMGASYDDCAEIPLRVLTVWGITNTLFASDERPTSQGSSSSGSRPGSPSSSPLGAVSVNEYASSLIHRSNLRSECYGLLSRIVHASSLESEGSAADLVIEIKEALYCLEERILLLHRSSRQRLNDPESTGIGGWGSSSASAENRQFFLRTMLGDAAKVKSACSLLLCALQEEHDASELLTILPPHPSNTDEKQETSLPQPLLFTALTQLGESPTSSKDVKLQAKKYLAELPATV